MKSKRPYFASAAFAAALSLSACGESASSSSDDDIDTLILSAVPAEQGTSMEATYDPLIKLLEDELGIDVEFQPATDYAALIEAQRSGQVHIAQYGPFSYYLAEKSGSPIEVLGAMVQEKDIPPGYVSYGIAPADSDIESIEDFADKTICFTDPNSTSGYLYPQAGLLAAGLEEGDYEAQMAGGHDSSIIGVDSGQCDAGFAFDSMVDETAIENGLIEEGDIKVVWESETIASSPIAIWSDLPDDIKTKVHAFFKDEKTNQDYLVANEYCEEGNCDLTDERIWGWEIVPDDFYDGVAEVCRQTQSEQCA